MALLSHLPAFIKSLIALKALKFEGVTSPLIVTVTVLSSFQLLTTSCSLSTRRVHMNMYVQYEYVQC